LAPFLKFQKDANLEAVHKLMCPDLDLMALGMEYNDFTESGQFSNLTLSKIISQLLAAGGHYDTLARVYARILAAKPHSADVERLISSSNALKSIDRSRMSLETENYYLYVHYNMPAIDLWDPRPAVLTWLSTKARRTREVTKAKEQNYFKGVFSEAQKINADDSLDAESDTAEPPLKKRCF